MLSPVFLAVTILYAALCATLLGAEYTFGLRRDQIAIRRRVPPRLSLAEAETVELEVRNLSPATLRLEVLDTTPPEWEAEGLPLTVTLPPHGATTLTYQVTSATRGRFRFGDLFVRAEQFPGLLTRQLRIPAGEEARVYPDMRDVERYEALTRRSRLRELGIHRSRLAGRG